MTGILYNTEKCNQDKIKYLNIARVIYYLTLKNENKNWIKFKNASLCVKNTFPAISVTVIPRHWRANTAADNCSFFLINFCFHLILELNIFTYYLKIWTEQRIDWVNIEIRVEIKWENYLNEKRENSKSILMCYIFRY